MKIEGRFTAAQYKEILENHLLPFVNERFQNQQVRFVQDKSPIHTARVVTQWFREHPIIEILPWPSKGADLNLIENIWGDMVKDVNFRELANRDELFDQVEGLWERYKNGPQQYWQNLSSSMVRRLYSCLENEGYWIEY